MRLMREQLSIVGSITGWNLIICAGVGLAYGPAAEVVLVIIELIENIIKRIPDAFKIDPGAVFMLLIIVGLIGSISGAFIGLISGIVCGVIVAIGSKCDYQHLLDNHCLYHRIMIINTVVTGFIGLAVLMFLNLPSKLAYLGTHWIVIGWIFSILIPISLFAGITILSTNRALTRISHLRYIDNT